MLFGGKAIGKAEEELQSCEHYTVGDIVHNNIETERLAEMGLVTIDHEALKNSKCAFFPCSWRTTGNHRLQRRTTSNHDATYSVVLQLQNESKTYHDKTKERTQIVIYGKKGHAEVNGLLGQTEGTAIVIEKKEDLDKLDFSKDISLFSQTTSLLEDFQEIVSLIREKMTNDAIFEYHDTICRQVSNRIPHIKTFAKQHISSSLLPERKAPTEKYFLPNAKRAIPTPILSILPTNWICR